MAKISKSQMAKLFLRLSTSYAAGIDIRTAIEKEMQNGTPAFKLRARRIHRLLGEGKELAEAMEATDGYFPDLAISVVKAGERGGRLEEAFAKLGNHYKSLVTFRNNFLQALAWPAFELCFAILIVGGLMIIADNMMETLGMDKMDWLWMGSTMGNVTAYFVLVISFFAAMATLVIGTARGWFGNLPIRLAMRIPLIGPTIEALALSRFSWTMSIAENAGMSAIDIAQLSLRATELYYYQQLEPQICRSLQAGNRFHETLKNTETFPEQLLMYVDNGETAGELAESMYRLSDDYQAKAELNLKAIGTIGFVLTLLLVAGIVAAICIFAVQQYINILNNVGNF
ncbi:MAG: type II secretion system F family protein [Planctomycetota bacterium]